MSASSLLHDGLDALAASALSRAISQGHHLIGATLQIVHIGGFTLLLSALLLAWLRLRRRVLDDTPLAALALSLLRLAALGLVLAVSSGVLMFVASPALYAAKPVFALKLSLFAAVVAGSLAWVRALRRQVAAAAPVGGPVSRRLAWGSSVALLGWLALAGVGRAIGFA